MSGKAIIPLVAGLCIGGLALKIGIDKIRSAEGSQPKMVEVWVPREHIPVGVQITPSMIQAVQFPSALVPKDIITKEEDVVGRVPQVGAPAGLPVLESMLLPPGTSPGLHVKPGFRAVAVKVDEGSGVGNHLRPGAWVDVIGYFHVTNKDRRETVARTIIENVEVGAVGPWISPDRKTGESGAKTRPARAVTLFVKPEYVPTLHLAEQRGKIKLSMRNKNDAVGAGGAFATEHEVVTGEIEEVEFGPLEPPKEPEQAATEPKQEIVPIVAALPEPEPVVVVVWNGDVKEVTEFKSVDSMETVSESTTFQRLRESRAARTAAGNKPPVADAKPDDPGPSYDED